jgi:hypothetical protein
VASLVFLGLGVLLFLKRPTAPVGSPTSFTVPLSAPESLPEDMEELLDAGQILDAGKTVSQNISNLVTLSRWQMQEMDTNSMEYRQMNTALNLLGSLLQGRSQEEMDGLSAQPLWQRGMEDLLRLQSNMNQIKDAEDLFGDLLDEGK